MPGCISSPAASLGRSEDRFAYLLASAQELSKVNPSLSGVDLHELVAELHASWDGYGSGSASAPPMVIPLFRK